MFNEVGNFKIGGKVINKARLLDNGAITDQTKEELQNTINSLVGTGRKYGNGNQYRQMKCNEYSGESNHCAIK